MSNMNPYDLAYEQNRLKFNNPFAQNKEQPKEEESLSTKDKIAIAQGIGSAIPASTNAAGVANQPSAGGALSSGLQAGLTAGAIATPMAGLAVGGLVAAGSYMQASANADEARRQRAAAIAADAHKQQALLTQSRGQAYSDYAIRMAQLAERL